MSGCRGCGSTDLSRVLDVGKVPLRYRLEAQARSERRVYGYGASSLVPALFSIADASPAKQGCRISGTDVAIISPEELVDADPDCVFSTIRELYDEVGQRHSQLNGRWSLEPIAAL